MLSRNLQKIHENAHYEKWKWISKVFRRKICMLVYFLNSCCKHGFQNFCNKKNISSHSIFYKLFGAYLSLIRGKANIEPGADFRFLLHSGWVFRAYRWRHRWDAQGGNIGESEGEPSLWRQCQRWLSMPTKVSMLWDVRADRCIGARNKLPRTHRIRI